jgi:predicted Ser/Thr protein kinase
MSQLNLGLNVHQILNKEEDEKDRQADVAALMAKQDEILQLVAEDKKETQRLALDEENRHLVLMQQMASMRFFLQERLQPQKKEKPPISKKLLVPFYDLSIDTLLVKGSFGNIYHGRWLQQEVAIKMIEGELTEAERKEFIREVRIMKELRSKHVMTLYAVCDEPGRACLVMEYMEQGSLRSLLDRGALPDDEDKHRLIIEVALGLHYLHSQDILHRDFKSANVLIDKFGAARIADFGLSKLTSKEMTTLGKKTDDIQWSAPEIIQSTGDNHAFSEASDVYSFGVVMWEILTGKKPYADLPLAEVAQKLMKGEHEAIPPTLPKVYQSLLKACWSEDRHSRPSMAQVIEQLRAFVPAPKDKEEIGASIMFAPSTVGAQAGFWPKPRERGGAGASSSSQSASPAVEPETYYMAGFGYEQEKSMEKAVAHYQKAASMGYPRAKTALAMHYMQGTGGLSVDKQKAHALLKEAAEGGHARGMRALAYQYEKGDGMPVDMEAAQRWYQKAADAGDEYAKDKLSRLQKGRGFQKA